MTSLDNVLRAFTATRPPHDDLLSRIACAAELDDRIPVPITLALLDGTVVRGSVASDMSMAEAIDQPLRAQFEEIRARPSISTEQATWMDDALPTLGGRGIAHWLKDLHERLREAGKRAKGDGKPLEWTELAENDLLILATFADRSAITIRNATVERQGVHQARRVPLMRVQFSAVASWWAGDEA